MSFEKFVKDVKEGLFFYLEGERVPKNRDIVTE